MKRTISVILAVMLLFSMASCGQNTSPKTSPEALLPASSAQAEPETVTDTYGNKFELPMKLDKVIVLNSAVYEMIYVLGKDSIVCGVGDTVDYPASALTKEKYGDWKKPNVEKIMEAKPDAVIGYSSYLDNGIAKQLTDAGIPVIMFDLYVPSVIPTEVKTLGKMLGAEDKADEFLADIKKIQELVAERTKDVDPITVYYEGYTDYKSVGKGSGGTELMQMANLNSLTSDANESYPEISDEWILEKNPQMMVKMVSSTKKILGADITDDKAVKDLYTSIAGRPGWSDIDAVKNCKVLILSSKIGTNPLGTAIAPLYMAKTAYPEKFKDIDPDQYLNDMLKKYWGTEKTGIWSYID